MSSDWRRRTVFNSTFLPYGFMDFQFLDSLLVRPHARHQPLGPRYLQTSMQGLLSRLVMGLKFTSRVKLFEHLLNTRFELSKPIKLFKKSLFEILEVEWQLSNADRVARADRFVALPAPDSFAF